ncbi:polysaccharide pyruvyl transferase family protein [Segatella baroniae]|uniref:polysaccharide pyruvyl transferase family protein n=1 Tax=Segatella baroniae TaxID=305719 RepID=UPI0004897997|nr:polysaccharide pyruvyl transferase family protein [Segatella baroniae]
MENKRKVGGVIIMHPNHNNYGTSLQGLATVRVIQKLGYTLRIIRYNKRRSILKLLSNIVGYIKTGAIQQWLIRRQHIKARLEHPVYAENVKVRTDKCNAFKKRFLEPLCDYYTGWDALTNGSKNYDIVFVGSDQVWSPMSLYAGFYNLLFVDKSVPQFSYSSSFGKSFIMDHQKKGVARFLNKMDAIGVREVRGAEIVKELTDRDATVVADPTLLLSKEDWDEQIKDSSAHIDEPYILCYMLGPRQDNRDAVTKLGKELGLKIVSFNHMDWYEPTDEGFGDINNYDSDCLDFVKLLSNAEYVVTDSFHCSVFSILFHKKFLTFYRLKPTDKKSSHSRIESLLGLMGLSDRTIKLMGDDHNIDDIIRREPNWEIVDQNLSELREKSLSFLKKCLEIKK